MAKITLRNLISISSSIKNLISLPLPAVESFRLAVAARQIQEKLNDFEKVKQMMFLKYGEEADNKTMKIKTENQEIFISEIERLLEENIELDIKPFPISVLGENKISASDMMNLSLFFTDT
jgi:hypothetical protein